MPKWGFSKREYFFDSENRVVAKGLSSVKFMSASLAEELYNLAKSKTYSRFVDVLYDLQTTSIDSRQLEILIKIDFFSQFGNQRELLRICDLFFETFKKGQAKQIQKSKIVGSPLDEIVRKYAVGETKSGASAKSYTLLDVKSILREAEDAVLALHNFKWEDKPFDELYKEYPQCKSALRWWCNVHEGNTTQWSIERSPYLKEFLIKNPPDFKISGMCCQHAKKNPIHRVISEGGYDLSCVGIRKSEGGIRSSTYKTCFSEKSYCGADVFRPIFWLRDPDKEAYCEFYGVTHSQCYTEYGLIRTGCIGCPFGKRFEEELNVLEQYEPKLYKAAVGVFGKSYEYTRKYLEFREEMKKNATQSYCIL